MVTVTPGGKSLYFFPLKHLFVLPGTSQKLGFDNKLSESRTVEETGVIFITKDLGLCSRAPSVGPDCILKMQ